MSQLHQFLMRILYTIMILGLIVIALGIINSVWHPFEGIIRYVNQDLEKAGSTLKSEVIGGVTLGALGLFLLLLLIPIFTPGIQTKAFLKSFFRGILASFVFLATDYFYTQMEVLGRFYLLLAMAGAIIITFVLVEIVVLTGRKQDHQALRTDITASIASGMAFGLIVKLATFSWTYLSGYLG